MSGRSGREEKLRALAGDKYGAVVISEMGGPKKDRKKELNDQIRGKIEDGSLDDVFRKNILGSYQQGSLGGEDDLLGELVRRQQAAAMMGGQAPPDQGALPPGTGPMASPGYGAPGQTAPPISPDLAQDPEMGRMLANSPYQFRYDVDADEKYPVGLRLNPTGEPDEIDREAAGYLGTKKWGTFWPQLFNELRNNTGLSTLMGESSADRKRLRNSFITGASKAVEEKNKSRR